MSTSDHVDEAQSAAVPDGEIDGGGERFVPELHKGKELEAEHEARYRWACAIAAGRRVLDAGCGVGWGTRLLAAAGATQATGVDLHAGAVAYARERAGALPVEYVEGDLRALPFADGAFDLVVCFEAIEHVADPGRGLDELRRVLAPGGVLLVSSPNRGVYPAGNPFHLHEYTAAELEAALCARFAHVAVHRQQTYVGSLLTDDAGYAADDADALVDVGVRKVHGGVPGDELYTVAAASDAPLPRLGGVAVLTAPLDLNGWIGIASAWEQRAQAAEAQLPVLQAERDAAAAQLAALQRSPSWRLTAPLRAVRRRLAAVAPRGGAK